MSHKGQLWIAIVVLLVLAGCIPQHSSASPQDSREVETPSSSSLPSQRKIRPTSAVTVTPTAFSQSESRIQLYSADAEPVSISIEGSIFLPKQLAQLALGERYAFVAGDEPGDDHGDGIIRIDLRTKTTEAFLSSSFSKGRLDAYHLIWHRPWLVFMDLDDDAKPFHWIIRVYNVETGENWDVLDIQDSLSWPGPEYSFDGHNLAVAYNAYNAEKKCGSSYLWVFDVQRHSKKLLDAHCAEYGPFIWGPVEIHKNVLVAEQDLPQNKGSKNRIVFMKKEADGAWYVYHREDKGYNSMPVMYWPWLVWKAGERYAFGKQNKAYNFVSGERLSIRVPLGGRASDPLLCNGWVIWRLVESSSSHSGIDGVAYLYHLPDGPFVKFAKTTKSGGGFGPFSCTPDGKVAWLYEMGNKGTLVEWGRLPNVEH